MHIICSFSSPSLILVSHLLINSSTSHSHFDIAECWFDKRSANKHISDFYHLHQDERLAALRDVRGGGSVPPLYMNDIRKWERSGQLTIVNNVEPRFISSTDTSGKALISLDQLGDGEEDKQRKKKDVQVEVDCVILACGLLNQTALRMNLFVRYMKSFLLLLLVACRIYPLI